MIKVALFIIVCSGLANECMPPYEAAIQQDHNDCMKRGYSESSRVINEIGQEETNKNLIYIRFICKPITITES